MTQFLFEKCQFDCVSLDMLSGATRAEWPLQIIEGKALVPASMIPSIPDSRPLLGMLQNSCAGQDISGKKLVLSASLEACAALGQVG